MTLKCASRGLAKGSHYKDNSRRATPKLKELRLRDRSNLPNQARAMRRVQRTLQSRKLSNERLASLDQVNTVWAPQRKHAAKPAPGFASESNHHKL
eukprot:2839157-Amphidinium_carterae.1